MNSKQLFWFMVVLILAALVVFLMYLSWATTDLRDPGTGENENTQSVQPLEVKIIGE